MLYFKHYKKVLIHRISSYLKKKNKYERQYKYGNYSITKYLETAKELNIEIKALGYRMYELRNGNITRRIMTDLTLDNENPVSCRLCCNKYLTYKVLENNGIRKFPKYKLYTFKEIQDTIRDFGEWKCPVVIKPCTGTNGGTGVTVNIENIKELKRAITQSFLFNRDTYLMEEYVKGSHFRILTLNGEFLSCCKRIPPRIKGNGSDTIRKLIDNENKRRNNDKSETPLYPIVIDNEARRKLKSSGKTLQSILNADEEYYIKDIANLHSGGEIVNIDNVSEDIQMLCKQISDILKIYLAGFDIITDDIAKPLCQANVVIHEVNTSPGIENMYAANSGTHVAEVILKDMFNI